MSHTDNWTTCESGELQGLRQGLVRAHRGKQVSRAAGVAGAVAAVLALGAFGLWPVGGAPPNQIACDVCLERMPAYRDHLVAGDPMPQQQAAEVAAHLAKCDKCRTHFDEAYPGVLPAAVSAATALMLLTRSRRAVRR